MKLTRNRLLFFIDMAGYGLYPAMEGDAIGVLIDHDEAQTPLAFFANMVESAEDEEMSEVVRIMRRAKVSGIGLHEIVYWEGVPS